MWTYLAILLSIVVLVGVFCHKAYVRYKNAQKAPESPEQPQMDLPENSRALNQKQKKELEELYKKAESLLKKGDEDEAIKLLIQVLSLDPTNQEAQDKLGMLYLNRQMFSAAAALFQQLAAASNDAVHFSHLGYVCYQQNELEEAKVAYQKSVELDRTRPQRFISLSQVYRQLKQPYHAIMALNKAIELDGENRDYRLLLSDLKKTIGEFDEALRILDELLLEDYAEADLQEFKEDILKAREAEAEK